MHEQSLMRALVRQVVALAEAHRASRVHKVVVRLGALGHGDPAHLHAHFAREACQTLAEGAKLEVVLTDDLVYQVLESLEVELVEA